MQTRGRFFTTKVPVWACESSLFPVHLPCVMFFTTFRELIFNDKARKSNVQCDLPNNADRETTFLQNKSKNNAGAAVNKSLQVYRKKHGTFVVQVLAKTAVERQKREEGNTSIGMQKLCIFISSGCLGTQERALLTPTWRCALEEICGMGVNRTPLQR